MSLLLFIVCCVAKESKAQKVITLKPNGEVKEFSSGELKRHYDRGVDGNRMVLSDSGQILVESYHRGGYMNGYYKAYKNGILVELGLYKDNAPVGTHYFWDEKGILKKSITYQDGKEKKVKKY